MGLTHTTTTVTKIVCDFGSCGKEFIMPDNPDENTPGVENTVSLIIARENRQVYFCGIRHLIAFALEYAKATPTKESRAHMAMAEIEDIPPIVDLSIKDPR